MIFIQWEWPSTLIAIPAPGTLIRRHRIPLPPPKDDQFYSVHHFNINQEIVLYSRNFMVTDCDAFTRNFLRKLGVRLNPPAPTPEDKYSSHRRQVSRFITGVFTGVQPTGLNGACPVCCRWKAACSLCGHTRGRTR